MLPSPPTRRTLSALFYALAICGSASANDAIPSPNSQTELRTLAQEEAVLAGTRLSARQRAFARLAVHPDAAATTLLLAQFDLFRTGQLPPALWLDLFEAAAKRDDPRLKAALAEREKALADSRDPLERFRECLEGGDAEMGRAIFEKKPEAGCIRCHSIDGKGGQVGPDLTWLRRSVERIRILESLLAPNATIAPGFQSASLTMKGGQTIAGVVKSETPDEIVITTVADGKQVTVKVADVVERTALPSPMPPHFGAVLDKHAIRDLVEFIAAGD